MKLKKELSADEVAVEIDKAVAGADTHRADQLDQLKVMREARTGGMEREAARLSAKLGSDHPRVAALTGAIETNRELVGQLTVEVERARTPTPIVDPKSWILHGYVRDKSLKGVAGVTVALYDEKGVWVQRLGYACTDAKGYFTLSATDISGIDRPVFVRVLRNGTVIYADKIEMTPELGRVDAREIVLTDDGRVCPPPVEPVPPPPKPEPAPPWTVRGTVSDGKSVFFAGLKVVMADKAGKAIAALGTRITDEKGKYEFIHQPGPFADLINPPVDLFVQVLDANQKVLSTSPVLHFEPGKGRNVNFTITPGSFAAPPKEGTAKTPTAAEKGKTE